MRLAVIADTHLPRGGRALPAACREELVRAQAIIHAGDLTSRAVLEELRGFGPPVWAVHGNADDPWLRETLPKELVVELDQVRLGVVHIPGPAAGRAARLVRRFPACDAVIYGHTHLPVIERSAERWLLNPGSPTERRRGRFRSMLVVEISGQLIEPRLLRLS
jgi:putative phosphoesterase